MLLSLTPASCQTQGRAQEAIACYEHVALLQPESPEAHANLASAYKDAARQDTAIQRYQRALQLRPDFPEAFANLVHSLQCICDWTERPALFSRLENEVWLTFFADVTSQWGRSERQVAVKSSKHMQIHALQHVKMTVNHIRGSQAFK